MRLRRILLPCAVFAAFTSVSTVVAAQNWTFQGTQICYNLGSTVQCYARGTISGFVSDRQRAFESGRLAGQGVGSLAGLLIAAWLNHRQQVRIETQELTRELQAYFDGELALLEDEQAMESEDQDSIRELGRLDTVRKVAWELQLQLSKKLFDQRAKYVYDLKGLIEMQAKEKRRTALRYFVDHEPDGAKARYGRQRTMAAQSYVVNQFLKALINSYRQEPPTEQENTVVSRTSLGCDAPFVLFGKSLSNHAATVFTFENVSQHVNPVLISLSHFAGNLIPTLRTEYTTIFVTN